MQTKNGGTGARERENQKVRSNGATATEQVGHKDRQREENNAK